MGRSVMPGCKRMAVNLILLSTLLILLAKSVSIDGSLDKIPVESEAVESNVYQRFTSMMLKKSARKLFEEKKTFKTFESKPRFRREDDIEKNKQDFLREEYERRLFQSLNIIGTIPATRLYVPEYIEDDGNPAEKPFNVEIGTVVGKVRKLFPHGKQLIVWPYLGWRNFTVDENTGDVKTTAKMDFELIWLYNMTIRDFRYNYSNLEPLQQPPKPDPLFTEDPKRDYVDHYLIVEVIDRNDHVPKFTRDVSKGKFSGIVNTNAHAGTPILYLRPEDDDSGPRGRIRFVIKTKENKQSPFTIDPKTHFLKTTGAELRAGDITVQVQALDYGIPAKESSVQDVLVRVGKNPPEFFETVYNLNFSEASVRGSVVGKVSAISRSGMPIVYEIIPDKDDKVVPNTFAINQLGEITLLRKLDYDNDNDTDKSFSFHVRAIENTVQGRTNDIKVNLKLTNADDHLGMFKIPAKTLEFEEGKVSSGGDIFKVDVEDCDCKDNCQCQNNEMLYSIGDTKGFFDITSDGQIRNKENLDYETENYFFFPVYVTDPGTYGRTRTSYVEIIVTDVDDTAPKFPTTTHDFSIFEDAPKGQVVGVAQAEDPDPATKPEQISYKITKPNPGRGADYFEVTSQGVIKVLRNTNQFSGSDTYEMSIVATDSLGKESDPPALVTITVLDVNDHQPTFKRCESQKILEHEPVGTILTKLTATDKDRGVNQQIEYSIEKGQIYQPFKINNNTGEVSTTEVLDREKYDEIFVIAKATDGGATRSDALRQVGYCQFIVKVEDVNDHHPVFTVGEFEVTVLRTLAVGKKVLDVEAIDPDLGENAKIQYSIVRHAVGSRSDVYLEVEKDTGSLKVKNSLSSLDLTEKIVVVIRAENDKKVVGPRLDQRSETTVTVSLTKTPPPQFTEFKYVVSSVKEDIDPGSRVLTLAVVGGGSMLYSLQSGIRNRDDLPFDVSSSSGEIKTRKPLDYEKTKKYIFAVTAQKTGNNALSSAIVEINIGDIDDVVPIFGDSRYEATVSEAAGADTNVFRVQASDPDPINGGKIIYSIEKKHDYQVFAVEQRTGYAQIKTAKGLKDGFFDREKQSVYTIVMEAYRENAPKLKSTASLIVNVRDENDSPPIFKKKVYTAAPIPENIGVPYKVPGIRVEATDNDVLENAEVFYFITAGNDGRFAMNTIFGQDNKNYGQLTVIRSLDAKKTKEFEQYPVYNLTVTATDRKHTATATINIRVLDRPDTKPEFLEQYYEKYLPENTGPGIPVVQVKVKTPEDPKAVILYKLDKKATQYFAIDEDKGRITTAGEPLDWEVNPVITFPVYAYEKRFPNITGQTFVRVVINDANDASPIFPDQPYIGYISENASAGAFVRYINGRDLDNPDIDNGRNVRLRYELLTNTGEDPFDKDGKLFEMNSEGRLTIRNQLDAEKYRRNLSIRVRAWDDGNPRLYGETDVTIVILDVSEKPAWFRKPKYEATVSETRPPGFVVLQLTTKDEDFAPPNNYAFSLKSGNTPYAFDINQATGEIVVAGLLDIEKNKKRVYTLTVGLKERSGELIVETGIGLDVPFEDTAEVIITVTEGNDNRPTFTKDDKTYTKIIPENTRVGTRLNLGIEATDDDIGYSDKFRFYIKSGNIGDWFGVMNPGNDPSKADIFIQYPLDREFQDLYVMQLVVVDNGGVSDTAWLRITLTDVNDNPPTFLPSFYTASMTENSCDPNIPLVTLSVIDRDLPPQGPVTFEFAPKGNPSGKFQLRNTNDNSTKLYCSGNLDREETPDVKVVIKATDNPAPQDNNDKIKLSSTANVFIHVKDIDEFSPTSASMKIIVNALDGKFGGGPIGKTYFQDRDGDGDSNIKYTLTGSEEFTVKSNDGWISAKSTVKVGKYQLKIQGQKSSSRPSCNVEVTVRDVPRVAVENSAAIQLHEVLDPKLFLNPIPEGSNSFKSITPYDRFVNMLEDLFDVSESDVFVFSVQTSKRVKPGRQYPAIDVHFAIRKASSVKGPFLPRYVLINVLEKNNETLQELGFKIGMIGLDYCVREKLKSGMCRNLVKVLDEYPVVSSDYGLIPIPKYAVSIVSIKVNADATYDRYAQDPDPEYDTCVKDVSCLNGGTCHDVVERGFVCECPGAYSGPRCQLTTRTFEGDSYIWLPPKTSHNFGSVSLEFATAQSSGLLLYQGPAVKYGNNNHSDFLAISLKNGRIQVGLSFGGEPLLINLDKGPELNDRKWHHVRVSHARKEVTVIVDNCKNADIVEDDERIVELRENCEFIKKTTRNYEYLNGLGPMQIGGIERMPLDYPPAKYVMYKYFHGCIRKITENLEMYDLAYPLKVVNAPVGCTIMAPCPKCLHEGYCHPGFSRSVCVCRPGYVGDDCSGNAPRYWYLANSFTEYKLPGEEGRRKRSAVNEPSDLLDRYSGRILMQIRLDPGVKHAIFFYSASEDNKEYSILAYEDQKLYYEFKLLDALVRLEMDPNADVADSRWHNVSVTREGNFAVLQVDYKGRVSRNTGGMKKLIRMGSSKILVGGLPEIAPNHTTVDKVVEAAVTDLRFRRRRSAGTVLGVTTDGKVVENVGGDMQGCTGSSNFNGKNLDTDPNVGKSRVNVEIGCPCREVLQCRNGGVCVGAVVQYCQCTHGWSGRTCEDIVYVAPVLGNRVDGRARWQDGGVLVVILVVVLCVLVLAVALLVIKKRREAPYSVPVGDEGQDSIMPYHDEGAGEEDTFNYDIHHLMKYSYRDGHGTITKSVNGKELAAENMELLNQAPDGGGAMMMTERKQVLVRESVDLWPFILERVQKADEDLSWWPGDEMRHWEDEGDEGEQADLSDIEESEDEGEVEQDWDFLKDWGKKFENLNKIFNPEDEEDEDTEA